MLLFKQFPDRRARPKVSTTFWFLGRRIESAIYYGRVAGQNKND
jgi:hypothetical protein